jgi:hypothetical protein
VLGRISLLAAVEVTVIREVEELEGDLPAEVSLLLQIVPRVSALIVHDIHDIQRACLGDGGGRGARGVLVRGGKGRWRRKYYPHWELSV